MYNSVKWKYLIKQLFLSINKNIIEKANKIEMFNEISNSGGAPMVKGEIRFENKSEYR